ncbi:unnamed protein product, partial [Pylaiella littoralis]
LRVSVIPRYPEPPPLAASTSSIFLATSSFSFSTSSILRSTPRVLSWTARVSSVAELPPAACRVSWSPPPSSSLPSLSALKLVIPRTGSNTKKVAPEGCECEHVAAAGVEAGDCERDDVNVAVQPETKARHA